MIQPRHAWLEIDQICPADLSTATAPCLRLDAGQRRVRVLVDRFGTYQAFAVP